MKISSKYKFLTSPRKVSFVLFFLLIIIAGCFEYQSYNFGNYKFSVGRSSGVLKVEKFSGWQISGQFLKGVGGVAFDNIAYPDNNLLKEEIKLSYIPNRADGQRLKIDIGNQKCLAKKIPDWLLIPIANYANSEYHACVSLFGNRSSNDSYDIIYHPAFENTLLGLRLLHADVMLITPSQFTNLPKLNDKTILGEQESSSYKKLSYRRIKNLRKLFSETEYHSWVIADDDLELKFKISSSELKITGNPYPYFWIEKPLFSNRYRNVRLLTDSFKDGMIIKEINENVYEALKTTMQLSAFFRYVKTRYPNNWQKFYSQIKDIEVYPKVKTPTKWSLLDESPSRNLN